MARKQDRQRKLERKAKKASKRRQRGRERQLATPKLSSGAAGGLQEAQELLDQRQVDEAIVVLEELQRRYPNSADVAVMLGGAYLAAGDSWSYQAACQRMCQLAPDVPMSWLALGAAAVNNIQPSVAYKAFSHFVSHWPDHPEAPDVRGLLATAETLLDAELQQRGLDSTSGRQVLKLHDELQLHLHRSRWDRVVETAGRLLSLCPTFAPALNNRSEAHFQSGRAESAIADCRRVLDLEPDNFHALANLARFEFLSGRFQEAEATAARLAQCRSKEPDSFVKKAETFAYLGDWEGVRRAYQDGSEVWNKMGGPPPLAEHLVGVAEANLGNLRAAQRHWRRANKRQLPVEWANRNLEDSNLPPGERHGPWAFPIQRWIPETVLESFVEQGLASEPGGRSRRFLEKWLSDHPQFERLADLLVERSDPFACEMVIQFAKMVDRPAITAALKKFALGQRGADEQRMQALLAVSQRRAANGLQRIWRRGEPTEVNLTSQDIYTEPENPLPAHVSDLATDGYEAVQEGRGVEGERLLDQAIRLLPNEPSLQFNRAMAIILQGRVTEGLAIVSQIHQEHPDYLFARVHLAVDHIRKGELEAAKNLLSPLHEKTRLHITEYNAWMIANVELSIASGDPEMARSALNAWEAVSPDDERIAAYRRQLNPSKGLLDLLPSWALGR